MLQFYLLIKINSLVIKNFQIYLFATAYASWLERNSLGMSVFGVDHFRSDIGLPVRTMPFYAKINCDKNQQDKNSSGADNHVEDCFVQTKHFFITGLRIYIRLIKNQIECLINQIECFESGLKKSLLKKFKKRAKFSVDKKAAAMPSKI